MKSIEPWPSTLTEGVVLYAQSTARDFFALLAFKGKNACHGKAIALDVHSTPGALKEDVDMWKYHNTRAFHPLQSFNPPPQIIYKCFSSLEHYLTASLHSHTI
jgi:hypothetical protein